jgi:PilZ domain-containing protein
MSIHSVGLQELIMNGKTFHCIHSRFVLYQSNESLLIWGLNIGFLMMVFFKNILYNLNDMKQTTGDLWKRKYTRIKLEMKGDYRVIQGDGNIERHSTRIKTLGGGGLMCTSSDPITIGTRLQIRLFHFTHIITVNSKVVWTELLENRYPSIFNIGIKFLPSTQSSLLQVDFILNSKNS